MVLLFFRSYLYNNKNLANSSILFKLRKKRSFRLIYFNRFFDTCIMLGEFFVCNFFPSKTVHKYPYMTIPQILCAKFFLCAPDSIENQIRNDKVRNWRGNCYICLHCSTEIDLIIIIITICISRSAQRVVYLAAFKVFRCSRFSRFSDRECSIFIVDWAKKKRNETCKRGTDRAKQSNRNDEINNNILIDSHSNTMNQMTPATPFTN